MASVLSRISSASAPQEDLETLRQARPAVRGGAGAADYPGRDHDDYQVILDDVLTKYGSMENFARAINVPIHDRQGAAVTEPTPVPVDEEENAGGIFRTISSAQAAEPAPVPAFNPRPLGTQPQRMATPPVQYPVREPRYRTLPPEPQPMEPPAVPPEPLPEVRYRTLPPEPQPMEPPYVPPEVDDAEDLPIDAEDELEDPEYRELPAPPQRASFQKSASDAKAVRVPKGVRIVNPPSAGDAELHAADGPAPSPPAKEPRLPKGARLIKTERVPKTKVEPPSFMDRVGDTLQSLPAGAAKGIGMGLRGFGEFAQTARRTISRPVEQGFEAMGLDPRVPKFLLNPELPGWADPAEVAKVAGGAVHDVGDAIGVDQKDETIATDIAEGVGQLAGQIAVHLGTGGAATGPMLVGQGVDIQAQKMQAAQARGAPAPSEVMEDTAKLGGGLVTMLTEQYGLDKILNRVPPAIKNRVLNFIADAGIGGGIEAAQEVTEGLLQNLIEKFGYNPNADVTEGLSREAIAAGGAGAVVRGAVNLATPGRARPAPTAEEPPPPPADAPAGLPPPSPANRPSFQEATGATSEAQREEQFRARAQQAKEGAQQRSTQAAGDYTSERAQFEPVLDENGNQVLKDGEPLFRRRPAAKDTPNEVFGQDQRAPQTRDDLEGQRQAEGAFDVAERQRGRAEADPSTYDTQAGGRPQGRAEETVYLDDGFPVEILETRYVPDKKGRSVEVAKVRRYDPRTKKPEADAVEYEVETRKLKQAKYATDPHQAQDFEKRAQTGKVNNGAARGQRMDDAQGLRQQTYRTTPPDPNTEFPGASQAPGGSGAAPAAGRAPFPEQPEGPAPGPQKPRTEEEYVREYERKQAEAAERARRAEQEEAYRTQYEQERRRQQAESETYAGAEDTFSNQPADRGADGYFATDEHGYVRSKKGGPVRWTQKEKGKVAKILMKMAQESPDQTFEIANHPGPGRSTGRGASEGYLTIRETERRARSQQQDSSTAQQEPPKKDKRPPKTGTFETPPFEKGPAPAGQSVAPIGPPKPEEPPPGGKPPPKGTPPKGGKTPPKGPVTPPKGAPNFKLTEPPAPKPKAEPAPKAPPRPRNIIDVIKAAGGIKASGETRARDLAKRYPGVVRDTGRSEDEMRQLLADEGFFGFDEADGLQAQAPAQGSTNRMWEMIENHSRTPQYAPQDQHLVGDWEAYRETARGEAEARHETAGPDSDTVHTEIDDEIDTIAREIESGDWSAGADSAADPNIFDAFDFAPAAAAAEAVSRVGSEQTSPARGAVHPGADDGRAAGADSEVGEGDRAGGSPGQRGEAPASVTPKTEKVATVDGKRDQFVMPGTEQSARQAAAAREKTGRGKIVPKKQQKEADHGMFAAPPDTRQSDLLGRAAPASGSQKAAEPPKREPSPSEERAHAAVPKGAAKEGSRVKQAPPLKLKHDEAEIEKIRDAADELEEYLRAFLAGRAPNRGDYTSEFNLDSAIEAYRQKHGDDMAADVEEAVAFEARRLSAEIDALQAPDLIARDRQQKEFEEEKKRAKKAEQRAAEEAAMAKSLNTPPTNMSEWVDHVLARARTSGKMSAIVKSYGREVPVIIASLTRSKRHEALIGNFRGLERRRLSLRQMDQIAKQFGAVRLRTVRSLSAGKQTSESTKQEQGTRSNPAPATKAGLKQASAQVDKNPSPDQKFANNYAHGHAEWNGLGYSMETPIGGERTAAELDENGKPIWKAKLPEGVSYGYFKNTEGADGEGVDVFMGPNPESETVWVIDQQDAGTKAFDEHKVMAGFESRIDAVKAYKQSFSDGKGWARIKDVTQMTIEELKKALKSMWQKKPIYKGKPGERGGLELPTREDLRRVGRAARATAQDLGRQISKIKGGPLKRMRNAYTLTARKLISEPFHNAVGYRFNALGKLPWQKDYLLKRYIALGKIGRIDDTIGSIYAAFRDATPEQARQVYHYLTTRGAHAARVDEKYRNGAIDAKQRIDRVGRALVERGMLSQESYEKYAGQYLPRIYLKHVLGETNMRSMGAGRLPSDMGYLKERKDIDEETRKLILGEIEDPAFLASQGIGKPMRDIAILDFLNDVAQNKDWVLPSSLVEWKGRIVSAIWLKGESKRVAEMSTYVDDPGRAGAMREMARTMAATADAVLDNQKNIPDDYKQVPDNARYGTLAGMWIRKEIYDDLVGGARFLPRDTTWVESVLGAGGIGTKVTQLWKLSKVALNPPSQVRNFVSNAVLLQLSGVPMHLVPARMLQAINEMRREGPHWKIAKKYGVNATTFTSAELHTIHKELRDLEAREGGAWQKVRWAGSVIAEKASNIYGLSEAIFKTAKIIDAMQREGMNEGDAALAAQEAVFDYGLVPPAVRYARNSPFGMPFLSFYYFAAGRLAKIAVETPWRYAPYIALTYGLSELLQWMYDVDDEDLEALTMALPQWLREEGGAYLFPFKDAKGRWQFVNLGYFFPWQMVEEAYNKARKGDATGLLETVGVFGAPIADLAAAIKTNVDPFTGDEIMNEADPPAKRLRDLMTYLWRMAAPTWVTDIGAAQHLYNSLFGTGETRRGEPAPSPTQSGARFFGLNVYPIDPEKTRADNIRYMGYAIEETERRRTRVARDRSLTPAERKAAVKEYNDHIAVLRHRMREYNKASRVHPNLRTTRTESSK